MVTITNDEVQAVFGEKEPGLSEPKQTAQREIAERYTDQVRNGRVSTLSEIEGSEEDFAKYVAAHLWHISTGRSLNQEFQTGNTNPIEPLRTNPRDALAGTIYGETALMIAGGERGSIGIVRSYF